MKRNKPPFRADHVGSILRTAPVKEARAKRETGEIGADELRKVEDREIEKIIRKQEEIGLQLATDGEFRRSWWHFDFLGLLDGAEVYESGQGIQFQGVTTKGQSIRVTGKVDFPADHPMLDHFRFLKAHTRVTPKMTIPSPSVLHYRGGREAIDKQAYPTMDLFFDDLGKTYRKAVRAFYDAGCRYLQFDDTVWAYLCSQDQREKARHAARTSDKLPGNLRRHDQLCDRRKAGRHDDHHACVPRQFPLHLDLGRRLRAGGRDACSARCNYDGYFLEYDTERAGGFEPLRFVPKGKKTVVLGLVTSKTRHLGEEGRHQAPHRRGDQIRARSTSCACSPQCGFASTEEGNVLADDEQWAKLRMIVEIADDVWTLMAKPPFRADHVGSLLRTAPLKEARRRARKATSPRTSWRGRGPRDREDRPQAGGGRLASSPPTASSAAPGGISISSAGWTASSSYAGRPGHPVPRRADQDRRIRIAGKIEFAGHPMVDHFKFLAAHDQGHAEDDHSVAGRVPFPPGPAGDQQGRLSRLEPFFDDVAEAWRKAVRAFYDAGCRYLQLDDTTWAMICSPKEREASRKRGDDPDSLPPRYARMINTPSRTARPT